MIKPVFFGVKWTALLFVVSLGLSGCSLFGDDELQVDTNSGEQQMYRQAQRYIDTSNFDLAISALMQLESRYPFGKYAEQAQLELIYAHHGAYQNEAAIEAADRFIRLHPQHPSVDYAFYMKGVAAYDLNKNFLASLIPSDDSKRDVTGVREAFSEFSQLLNRYPNILSQMPRMPGLVLAAKQSNTTFHPSQPLHATSQWAYTAR